MKKLFINFIQRSPRKNMNSQLSPYFKNLSKSQYIGTVNINGAIENSTESK